MYITHYKIGIAFLLTTILITLCTCHGHDHDNDEPAHFKYSQHANEVIEDELLGNNHDHHDDHHGDHHHDDKYLDEEHNHDHHHSDHHGHSHDHVDTNRKPKSPVVADFELWMKALGSTALVSIAPIFILILIPLDQSKERDSLLKVLLSFASGGLLGDAFLHLIPHALNPHTHGDDDSHSHSHSHSDTDAHDHSAGLKVGIWVLAGIIAFLCVEKFVRIMKLGHSHDKPVQIKDTKDNKKKTISSKKVKGDSKQSDDEDDEDDDIKDDKVKVESHSHEGDIQVSGYLNLVADFTHNFTDGLAIGVSYLLGQNIGILTTITILFHEIPHEIGDFAILVQSGCSKKKAMMLQFSTAIGAMAGTFVSLALGGVGPEAMAWILPFTAGGFIYIATVSVIPELLKETSFIQSVKEIIALLIGVGMMVIIGLME